MCFFNLWPKLPEVLPPLETDPLIRLSISSENGMEIKADQYASSMIVGPISRNAL